MGLLHSMLCCFVIAAALLLTERAQAKTDYTGDRINGYPVISRLDLNDITPNSIQRCYFRAAEAQGSFYHDLPLIIVKGREGSLKDGRKLSLSAAVHGDELNGIRVIQRVIDDLQDTVTSGKFEGAIIALPVLNPSGVHHNQRNFYSSDENGFLFNMNRMFPGKNPAGEKGAALAEAYGFRIWTDLWDDGCNVDVAVDLHTVSMGMSAPLWVYANTELPDIARLAELVEADILLKDPGEKGTVEYAFVEKGIPAITLELGSPKVWNDKHIDRGYDFIFRLLAERGMIQSKARVNGDRVKTFVAQKRINLKAKRAGFAKALVPPLADVKEGEEILHIFNHFGDLVDTITSPINGKVLQSRTDPAVEQGAMVMVVVNS